MRVQLANYEDASAKQLLAILDQAHARLLSILTSGGVFDKDLRALERNLDSLSIMKQAYENALTKQITDASVKSGLYTYDELNKIVGWDGYAPEFVRITATAAELAAIANNRTIGGKVLADWVANAMVDTEVIRKEAIATIASGEGYDVMIERLEKAFGAETDRAKREIEALSRTYGQAMNSKAQEDIYRANPETIRRVEWSAILEVGYSSTGHGTCPRCAALDGNEYTVDSAGIPNLPLHPNCRCFLNPVTQTWAEMGLDEAEMERAYRPVLDRYDNAVRGRTASVLDISGVDMTRQTATDMMRGKDYEEVWWKWSKKRQDNTIGPVRANLVRDTGLKFGELVNSKGDLIPLVELPGVTDTELTTARARN